MLRPICNIVFTKENGQTYTFDYCTDIEIKTSCKDFTDTAKITLPRKFSFKGKALSIGRDSIFNRGDKVVIKLGYFPDLKTVFEGFVSAVNASLPIVLECEDKMFELKNTNVTYPKKSEGKTAIKNLTLKQLLSSILPSTIQFTALDTGIEGLRFSNISVCKILDYLKIKRGFYSYFRNGVLNVGFPYDASFSNTINLKFEKDIIDDSDLNYKKKEDMLMQVVAISIQDDNTKKEYKTADVGGEVRTYHTSNVTDSDLKKFAELKLNDVRYTGYTGLFETFGEPMINHGDIVNLESVKLSERNGNYSVKGVVRRFGMGGYRQFVELGEKV